MAHPLPTHPSDGLVPDRPGPLSGAPAGAPDGAGGSPERPAVLRISHSAVVTAWRERDRQLRKAGMDVTLLSARQFDEGGTMVRFAADGDDFAGDAAIVGSHPNGFLYDPRALWRLMGRHWDLIDVHEEPFSLAMAEVLAIRALRARRVPFVFYTAQNIEKRYPPPFRWVERLALRRGSAAYACSTGAGDVLTRKGMRGEVCVVPLGTDLSHFSPVARDAPDGRLVVGYVGRLAAHKGVDVLLHALAADARLVLHVAGDGPEAPALQALTRRLGLRDRVTFAGFVSQADLPDLYRTLDVLAVPSVPVPGWIEQFCRVAVEAMATGVPVVASDLGSLPEVVGDAGVLVAPSDPGALGHELARLLDEPGRWAELRRRALEHAARFSWAAVAEQQAAMYRRAIAGAGGRR